MRKSPLSPSQYKVETQKKCRVHVTNTVGGRGEGKGSIVSVACNCLFYVCERAQKVSICPKTFVHNCSSTIFEVGTPAKYCELKRCADPLCSMEPTTKMKS